MKRVFFLVLLALFFTRCQVDVYDGSTRHVIEGTVIRNGSPLANSEVSIYLVKGLDEEFLSEYYSKPISEIQSTYRDNHLSTVLTDGKGHFKFGIPGLPTDYREMPKAFVVKARYTYFGYITGEHLKDYYLNLNELTVK